LDLFRKRVREHHDDLRQTADQQPNADDGEGGRLPKRGDAVCLDGWNAPYAKGVDPCATYSPPKTGG
jgi:hypothetical protein